MLIDTGGGGKELSTSETEMFTVFLLLLFFFKSGYNMEYYNKQDVTWEVQLAEEKQPKSSH